MDIQKYLESEGYIKNEHEAFIYSYKEYSVNMYYLLSDFKSEIACDIKAFIKANPKITADQITEYLNSL